MFLGRPRDLYYFVLIWEKAVRMKYFQINQIIKSAVAVYGGELIDLLAVLFVLIRYLN